VAIFNLKIAFGRRSYCLALIFLCSAICVNANGQETLRECNSLQPMSESYLSCVIAQIDAAERMKSIAPALLEEPLRSYLKVLSQSLGYQGAPNDLERLKSISTELKRDPRPNRDAIANLDAAIAANHDELGPSVSTRALATSAKAGTNIYRPFIQQKLAFLDSPKATFYDRGPYEITRRSLLANSIESEFFLEKQAGNLDKSKLRKEISILDEIVARLTEPQFDYLIIPQRTSRINSNKFWRASLLYALGDRSELREMLHNFSLANRHFELESNNNPGQVYIYRVFDLPIEMIVQPGSDGGGGPDVETRATDIVQRYFNAAQLALVACAHLEEAGSDEGIMSLIKTVDDLVPSDYYVIAASADDRETLKQFDAVLHDVIFSDKLKSERERLLQIIHGQESHGFYDQIKKGAELCGIDDAGLGEIFSPFQITWELRHIEGLGKHNEILTFGGRLNGNQARTLANFLTEFVMVLPEIHAIRNIDTSAYVARMRIDQ
jgi:hypothetical protein